MQNAKLWSRERACWEGGKQKNLIAPRIDIITGKIEHLSPLTGEMSATQTEGLKTNSFSTLKVR